jgi:hypothetical protein
MKARRTQRNARQASPTQPNNILFYRGNLATKQYSLSPGHLLFLPTTKHFFTRRWISTLPLFTKSQQSTFS